MGGYYRRSRILSSALTAHLQVRREPDQRDVVLDLPQAHPVLLEDHPVLRVRDPAGGRDGQHPAARVNGGAVVGACVWNDLVYFWRKNISVDVLIGPSFKFRQIFLSPEIPQFLPCQICNSCVLAVLTLLPMYCLLGHRSLFWVLKVKNPPGGAPDAGLFRLLFTTLKI